MITPSKRFPNSKTPLFNPFQPGVAFYIETSHVIYTGLK